MKYLVDILKLNGEAVEEHCEGARWKMAAAFHDERSAMLFAGMRPEVIRVRQELPPPNYRCFVEISEDGQNWDNFATYKNRQSAEERRASCEESALQMKKGPLFRVRSIGVAP